MGHGGDDASDDARATIVSAKLHNQGQAMQSRIAELRLRVARIVPQRRVATHTWTRTHPHRGSIAFC